MINEKIGSYRLVRQIGEGGMGAVYEARALTPGAADGGERVAVKVLRPEYARNQAMVDRFFNEARALHRVDHEGTVAMIDCGLLDEETVYLVMEFLEGQTLKDRLRDGGALERQTALNVIWQLAGTLAAAHEKGIIHRDLKPDNVFLDRERDPGREDDARHRNHQRRHQIVGDRERPAVVPKFRPITIRDGQPIGARMWTGRLVSSLRIAERNVCVLRLHNEPWPAEPRVAACGCDGQIADDSRCPQLERA